MAATLCSVSINVKIHKTEKLSRYEKECPFLFKVTLCSQCSETERDVPVIGLGYFFAHGRYGNV